MMGESHALETCAGRRIRRGLAILCLCAVMAWGLAPHAQAAADLIEFKATAQADNSVLVTWKTATELNSLAFRVYRSQSPAGPWSADQMINQQAAKGDGVTGADYDYRDRGVAVGVTYYYLLEELETNSNTRPFMDWIRSATVGQSDPNTPTPTPTATRTATATRTLTPTATPTRTPGVTDDPTATRQFTNTPRVTPSRTVTATRPPATATATASAGTPTPIASPQLSSPTAPPRTAGPTATPVPIRATTNTPTSSGTATASTSPGATASAAARSETAGPSATPSSTPPHAVFGPKETSQPVLRTTPPAAAAAPQAIPTLTPSEQAAHNTRLILALGGGAVGLAALLGAIAAIFWLRSRRLAARSR